MSHRNLETHINATEFRLQAIPAKIPVSRPRVSKLSGREATGANSKAGMTGHELRTSQTDTVLRMFEKCVGCRVANEEFEIRDQKTATENKNPLHNARVSGR